MKLFGGKNPLNGNAVLDIELFGLESFPGERKVRRIFRLPDNNLVMICTDIIGAFDQPHVTEGGKPAHYPGKGLIINAFSLWGMNLASQIMPTDYIENNGLLSGHVPKELWDRCSIHVPAKEIIKVEFVVRSSCEGSLAEKVSQGKTICGQELPKDLLQGQLLPRPFFTPTTKAPKGQKDQHLTLGEYFNIIDNDDLAHYLYGMAVILHLQNRAVALQKGLDRPDQKVEFGIFNPGALIMTDEEEHLIHYTNWDWDLELTSDLFQQLCKQSGFDSDSWKEMPLFDINAFARFAKDNAVNCGVRLVDEYGGTDDGRYRPISDTKKGRELIEAGYPEQGKIFLENYWCKEYFRLASKRTGKGGYEEAAKQEVIIPDSVLQETGRRNFMALYSVHSD